MPTNPTHKNNTPDKALVERATMAIKAVWQEYGLPVGPSLFEKMAEAALAAALSQPQHGGLVEAKSCADFQQRRGRLPDLIEETIAIYDGFMLDDDYDAYGCLDKIVDKLKTARDFYDTSAALSNNPVVGETHRTFARRVVTENMVANAAALPTPTDTADRREAVARAVYEKVRSWGDPVEPWDDLHPSDRATIASLIAGPLPEGWQPIADYEGSLGERVNLCWEAAAGLEAHVELGKWSGSKGWTNTYGKPFSGDPDYFQRLPAPPRPTGES